MSLSAESLPCVTRRFVVLVFPALRNSLVEANVKKEQNSYSEIAWKRCVEPLGGCAWCRGFVRSLLRLLWRQFQNTAFFVIPYSLVADPCAAEYGERGEKMRAGLQGMQSRVTVA